MKILLIALLIIGLGLNPAYAKGHGFKTPRINGQHSAGRAKASGLLSWKAKTKKSSFGEKVDVGGTI